MAFDNPPYVIDATTCDGEVIRRAISTLISPTQSASGELVGGIVTPGDLAITAQATPNMTVNMGVGEIWVPGTQTTTQGMYYGRNGAPVTLTIAAADPSLPRFDAIVVQVQDAEYSGSLKQMAAAVIKGTAAASPVLPTLPASSTIVAVVSVPAAVTAITSALILSSVVANRAVARLAPFHQTAETTANYTAVDRDMLLVTPGVTITLPAPQLGMMIGVQAETGTGASPVTVTTPSGLIVGRGLSGSTSTFTLGTRGASVILFCGDPGLWQIISGAPDTGWLPLTLASGLVVFNSLGGEPTPGVRVRGNLAQLRGGVLNSSGSPVINGVTLPTAAEPTSTQLFTLVSGSALTPMAILAATAVMEMTIAAGNAMLFDGVSYPID